MIDENEIPIEDEPNPERLAAMQRACGIFLDVARFNPETAPTWEDVIEVINGILRQDGDLTDPVAYAVKWNGIRRQREEAARHEAELEEQQKARQREIDDFKRPASEDRSALLAEMQSRQPQTRQSEPADLSHLSQAEFDAIPDVELRRMLGGEVRVEDRQTRTNARTVKEIRDGLILAGKIDNRAGVRQVRSIKFSQEELKAQEERARAIAHDKAERRRLEEQWRKR
jgi:hypothetical protein